jgi:hypothetical protein
MQSAVAVNNSETSVVESSVVEGSSVMETSMEATMNTTGECVKRKYCCGADHKDGGEAREDLAEHEILLPPIKRSSSS